MRCVPNSLLVYIPCHSDFNLAINQAKHIREEYQSYIRFANKSSFKITIVISSNNYSPSDSQINLANLYCDLVLIKSDLFLVDANIAYGFTIADQLRSNYLWILSVNDILLNKSLSIILENLTDNIDLLVTKVPESKSLFKIFNVIHPAMEGYSFGLISGVVYNCEKMGRFFNSAPFFIWTGWSQLSVIQNTINQKGSLDIRTVNTFEVYKQRQTKREKIAHKYGHSFYGYILLGYIFANGKKAKKKFIRQHIFKNTFVMALYRRSPQETNLVIDPEQYLIWNQDLAEGVIKKISIPLYCYYSLVSRLPFHVFKKSSIENANLRELKSD